MPKQKTSSQAKKKFKLTATGKLMRQKAGQSHNLESKSPKRKRAFGHELPVSGADRKRVSQMLGKGRR